MNEFEVMSVRDASRAHREIMENTDVRVLAQSDPVPNLAAAVGELIEETRRELETLTRVLRALDKARDVLADHGVKIDVELGPIGNAAAAARRDLERERTTPTFEMPRT